MKMNEARCFTSEKERLETFQYWPRIPTASPYEFVQAGFYYSGCSDKVICVFCNGELSNWRPTDIPMEQHRLKFPNCIYVQQSRRPAHVNNGSQNTSQVYRPPASPRSTINTSAPMINPSQRVTPGYSPPPYNNRSHNRPQTTHQHRVSSPGTNGHNHVHSETSRDRQAPDYSKEQVRLQSFTNWPLQYQDPVELSRAGFYYIGTGDRVQCFACKGLVKCWELGDDPWIEHAKFFPHCKYLHLCMGEDVTQDINKAITKNSPKEYTDAVCHMDVTC